MSRIKNARRHRSAENPPLGQADGIDGPGPTAAELDTLLTVASRVPDHGKLTPWRFIVFEGDARLKAGETIAEVFRDQSSATPRPIRSSSSASGWRARRW